VELADAERYREAYHNLVDEVGVLAARNELAEGEAHRLSQFNAEILGHTNPAQRIVYLDRVRRELAETKQVRFPRVQKAIRLPTFCLRSDVDCCNARA
jgi:hypothetical protein